MPPKLPKKFEGEGNPTEAIKLEGDFVTDLAADYAPSVAKTALVTVTEEERRVLKVLLDRDRTSRMVHGGLKSLLTMTDDEIRVLLNFLDRV